MIIYRRGGKYKWDNHAGKASGYRGRFLYVAIQNTKLWPENSIHERWGEGRVHGFLLKNVLGITQGEGSSKPEVPAGDIYGGFAIRQGVVKYSSVWLNSYQEGTDGSSTLSSPEQKLVDHVIAQWKLHGIHHIIELPDSLHRELTGC